MSWETSTRSRRLPRNWSAIRRKVLDRDRHTCQAVTHNPRCDMVATDVDHIHPGDDHSLNNLQALNHWCHKDKTTREAVARNRARSRRRPEEQHPGLRKNV